MENMEDMEKEQINYFISIMEEDKTSRFVDIANITQHIPSLITLGQNELLNGLVAMREVEEVVDHMIYGKDPGPDGFPTNFFHHLWEFIKKEVW